MSKRDQFMLFASAEVTKVGAQEVLAKGSVPGLTRVPTKDELNAYFKESGAANAYDPTIHWCGIFATYLLKKAGVNCHWLISKGIIDDSNGADVDIAQGADAQKDLLYGDVVIREPNHHHIIVLEPVTAGAIRCIEGNAGGISHPLLAMNWGGNMRNNTVCNVNVRYRIRT